jgi:hypothetical protein
VRQHRQQIEQMAFLRRFHLGDVAARKDPPRLSVINDPSQLQQGVAWRELWKPDVVEIARGKIRLAHAARRAPDSPDPQPLRWQP